MKRSVLILALCSLALMNAAGCKSAKQQTPAPQAAQPATPMAQAPGGLSGMVVETMNAGGYTYVLIENNGTKMWVAGPQTTVKVGQHVTCQPGAEMKNFTSPTMKRTFDSIIFSSGIQ